MSDTHSRTALVTGGNRGIGKAIVATLADQGMTVLLGCRDLESGHRAAKDLSGDIHVVLLDLCDSAKLKKQMARIDVAFPTIDILINNAAVLEDRTMPELDAAGLMHSMQVNAL
ncbi:MAG: SDR family NAD(P)-dependent oxidoreductase, partial [Cohaesibacter sp.]|nr:SDR family NAD(P)-dependent oxidoreductase [Cohaesibacter sp.]